MRLSEGRSQLLLLKAQWGLVLLCVVSCKLHTRVGYRERMTGVYSLCFYDSNSYYCPAIYLRPRKKEVRDEEGKDVPIL